MTNPINHIGVESRPVKWIIDGMRDQNIIVDDSFQRRYVWIMKDRVSLIETILLGYPIPEVYLWQNATDPETGNTVYSIVDGQQRLGAVHSFINDEFKLNKGAIDNKDAPYAGKSFSKLSPEDKSALWRYPFSVRFINESLDKSNIVELFLRLNRTSTTLNPQELRNAEFSGEFIKLAVNLAENQFWKKYNIFNTADIRRMLDVQFISTLLIFIRCGIEEETTQVALNRAYDQYNELYPEAIEDRKIIEHILQLLDSLIAGKQSLETIIKRKTHFYTIFNYGYYLLRKGTSKNQHCNASNKLDLWFDKYLNDGMFESQASNFLLYEYRVLNQEGVQKKANRLKRFEVLKEYVGL